MNFIYIQYAYCASRWQRQHMLPLQFSAAPKLFPSFDDYCKILHYQQSMLLGGLHSNQIMFKNLTEFLVNLYSNLSNNRGTNMESCKSCKINGPFSINLESGKGGTGASPSTGYPLLPLKQTKKVNGT